MENKSWVRIVRVELTSEKPSCFSIAFSLSFFLFPSLFFPVLSSYRFHHPRYIFLSLSYTPIFHPFLYSGPLSSRGIESLSEKSVPPKWLAVRAILLSHSLTHYMTLQFLSLLCIYHFGQYYSFHKNLFPIPQSFIAIVQNLTK